MTIATTQIRKSYACDGTTTAFPFPYQFLLDTDLVVLLVDDATGNFSTLTLSTDYTVSGGDGSSGTVTTTSTYASGKTLVIYNDPTATQGLDLVEGDELPPEEVEKAFDRLTLLHQRQDDRLDRALVVSDSDTSGADFTVPAPQALKYMRWNAAGTALELMSLEAAGDLAVSSYIETLLDDADEDAALTTLGLPLTADTYLRRNAGNTAFVAKTVAQVVTELAPLLAVERDWRNRNAIINGGCQVAQISAPSISGTYQYAAVDMFSAAGDGTPTAGTIAQAETTLLGNSGFALHVSSYSTGAGGTVKVRHRIESKDVRRFVNQAAIFHCKVYHDAGSAVDYTITVNKADAADNFSAVTEIASSAAATSVESATATQISLAVADMGDCSNGVEIIVSAACGSVSTKNFYTTEWQLESGDVATDFEYRAFAEELSSCERYYEIVYVGGVAYDNSAAAIQRESGQFRATKRVTPTGTVTKISGSVPSASVNSISTTGVQLALQSTAGSQDWIGTVAVDARL